LWGTLKSGKNLSSYTPQLGLAGYFSIFFSKILNTPILGVAGYFWIIFF